MGILETFFSSIVSGGLTGIIGVIVQRYADHENKKLDLQVSAQKQSHEIALRKVDAEIMAQEWTARTKVASIESNAQIEVSENEAFSKSFNEPLRYAEGIKYTRKQGALLVLLDFIRGVVRPGLTIYLCILTTLVYMHSRQLIGEKLLTPEQALEIIKLIIGTVLYLTTTCLLWWFGVRNKQQAPY